MTRNAISIVLLCQGSFSCGDLLARAALRDKPFEIMTFIAPWMLAYIAFHFFGVFLEMYLFKTVTLGRAMGLLAMMSLVLSNVLGLFFLNEILSAGEYLGVTLALTALLVLSIF